VALIIHEVRNTFGDLHYYVLPAQPKRAWRSRSPPAAGLAFHRDDDALSFPHLVAARVKPLSATFSGRRHGFATAALLRSLVSLLLVCFKIVALIHWDALRLWLKGARGSCRARMPQQLIPDKYPLGDPRAQRLY